MRPFLRLGRPSGLALQVTISTPVRRAPSIPTLSLTGVTGGQIATNAGVLDTAPVVFPTKIAGNWIG